MQPKLAEHEWLKALELAPWQPGLRAWEILSRTRFTASKVFTPKWHESPKGGVCELTQHSGFTHLLWARHHFRLFFKKILIYLIYFQIQKKEGETGREASVCSCLSHTPYWGPGL